MAVNGVIWSGGIGRCVRRAILGICTLTGCLLLMPLCVRIESGATDPAETAKADSGEWSESIDGLQSRLTILTRQSRLGRPIYARFEIRNTAATPRYIWDSHANYAGFLIVRSDEEKAPVDTGPGWQNHTPAAIGPGEIRAIFLRRDIASSLAFRRAGKYSLATRKLDGGTATINRSVDGRTEKVAVRVTSIPASPAVSITVSPGSLPEHVEILRRLRQELPESWMIMPESHAGVALCPRDLVLAIEQAEDKEGSEDLSQLQEQLNQFYCTVGAFGEEDEIDLDFDEARVFYEKQGSHFDVLGRSEHGPALLIVRPRLLKDWPGCVEKLRSLFVNVGPEAPRPQHVARIGNITCWHDGTSAALILIQKRVKEGEAPVGERSITWPDDDPDQVQIADRRFNLADGRVLEVDATGRISQIPLHWLPKVTQENREQVIDSVKSLRDRVFFRRLRREVDDARTFRFDPETKKGRTFERVMREFDRGFPVSPDVLADPAIRDFFLSDRIRGEMVNSLEQVIGTWGSHRRLYPDAIRIIRELVRPEDFDRLAWHFRGHNDKSPFHILALDQSQLKLRLQPESLARQFLEAARTAASRGDQPAKLPGQLGKLDFLHRLRTEPDYRPKGWETRLARCLPDGMQRSQLITLYALESIPLDLELPERPGRSTSFNDLLQRICYVTRGHLSPRPQEQIAALRYVARTKSCWFLPHIRAALESENAGVKTAARLALEACNPPAWQEPLTNVERQSKQFDSEQIDGILTRIDSVDEHDKDEPISLEDANRLRALVQLDFGFDRAAWLRWWEYDRYSRKTAADGQRPILITGRVTDEQGDPVEGARAMLALKHNFADGGRMIARMYTDRNGQFIVRAGYPKPTSRPTDHYVIDVFPGFLFVEKPGFHVAKCSRTQPVYFSERDISHDRLLRLPEGSLQRTGKPFHVEFTMSPAVEVRLRVEDPQGKRLEPIKVVAHWTAGSPRQFSPSESCFCCNEYHAWPAFDQDPADPSGRLRCDLISHKDSTFFEYQQFRAGIARAFSVYLDPAAEGEIPKPSGTSPAVPFPEPGRYIVRVRYDRDAPAGSRLTVLGSRKTP